jgi:hypothetical protein
MPYSSVSSVFLQHATEYLEIQNCSEMNFRAHFGGPSVAIEYLWKSILSRFLSVLPSRWTLTNFLMTLMFLKCPLPTLQTNATRFHLDHRTMMKKIQQTLLLILKTLPNVSFLSFEIY